MMAGDRPSTLSANLLCPLIERLQLTDLGGIGPVQRHRGRGALSLGGGRRRILAVVLPVTDGPVPPNVHNFLRNLPLRI